MNWFHDKIDSRGVTLLSSFLMVASLFVAGCQPVQTRAEESNQVLKDIRDTTVIPDLGSYDAAIQRKSLDRIMLSIDKAPGITLNLLVATLEDSLIDSRTKRVICTILAQEGDLRALPALSRMLAEGSVAEDDLLESALVQLGEKSVKPVARILAEGNVTARRNAASILLALDVPYALDSLQDRFQIEKDAEVRFLCVCGLAADARAESVSILAHALEDIDLEVRRAAWGGLARKVRPPQSIRFDPEASSSQRAFQARLVRDWLSGSEKKGAAL
ncbi:MAG: hypothetical protein AAEJ04_09090 [Planctomycetota bacterium]